MRSNGLAQQDRVHQRKNKRALILTKKGNLSKAYKTLTQDGLVDHDAIETLRKQHRREHMPILDLHSSRTQDIQDHTDWPKLISADAIYKHVRKQKNGKAPDRHGMRPEILKCLLDSPKIFDLYHKHILEPITQHVLLHYEQHSCIGAQMFAARKSDPTGPTLELLLGLWPILIVIEV